MFLLYSRKGKCFSLSRLCFGLIRFPSGSRSDWLFVVLLEGGFLPLVAGGSTFLLILHQQAVRADVKTDYLPCLALSVLVLARVLQ